MQVTAQLNNLRIAPRKVRLVARAVKGADALAAKHRLDYITKGSSKPLSKLLNSALANAHNNFHLVKENLFIKDVIVNEGAKLKRFRPKGFGMASPIEKKTSRIKIILEEKVPGLKAKPSKEKKAEMTAEEIAAQGVKETRAEKVEKVQPEKMKLEIKKKIGKKGGLFGQVGKIKKFFRRKAI